MSDNRNRYHTIKTAWQQLYPQPPTGRQAQHLNTLAGNSRDFGRPRYLLRLSQTQEGRDSAYQAPIAILIRLLQPHLQCLTRCGGGGPVYTCHWEVPPFKVGLLSHLKDAHFPLFVKCPEQLSNPYSESL